MPFNIDRLNRSRLKVTLIMCSALIVLTFFPMYIINKAASHNFFEINAAWVAWGSAITAIGTLAGYYINVESKRPSFVNQTISNFGDGVSDAVEKVLPGEDESDPAEIPL